MQGERRLKKEKVSMPGSSPFTHVPYRLSHGLKGIPDLTRTHVSVCYSPRTEGHIYHARS